MPPAMFGKGFGNAPIVIVTFATLVMLFITDDQPVELFIMPEAVFIAAVVVVNIGVEIVEATDDMFIAIIGTSTQRSPASIN